MTTTVDEILDAIKAAIDATRGSGLGIGYTDFHIYERLGGHDALHLTESQWASLLHHVRLTLERALGNLERWGGLPKPEAIIVACALMSSEPEVFQALKDDIDMDALFAEFEPDERRYEHNQLELAYSQADHMTVSLGHLVLSLTKGESRSLHELEAERALLVARLAEIDDRVAAINED